MDVTMTFDVPADVVGEVVDAVQAILDAHKIAVCRELVDSADALKKITEGLKEQHLDMVEQLKGIRRELRNLDVPA